MIRHVHPFFTVRTVFPIMHLQSTSCALISINDVLLRFFKAVLRVFILINFFIYISTFGAFAAPSSARKASFSFRWSSMLFVRLFGKIRMEVLKVSTALL